MKMTKPLILVDNPILDAVFGLLPPEGSRWPIEKQRAWLRALSAIFDVLYGPTSPTIKIDICEGGVLARGQTSSVYSLSTVGNQSDPPSPNTGGAVIDKESEER